MASRLIPSSIASSLDSNQKYNVTSTHQAIGLAKLIEDKILDQWHPPRKHFHRPPLLPIPPPPILKPPGLRPSLHALPALPPPPHDRLLNPQELQQRRALGLCFNCDDKFGAQHKCKSSQFLILWDASIPESDTLPSSPSSPVTTPSSPDADPTLYNITLKTFTGRASPSSFCLTVVIISSPVAALIDSGSTHNFLHPTIACRLSLPIYPSPIFTVTVGNGELLHSSGTISQLQFHLQGHAFIADFHILVIHGCELVLGN